MLSLRNLHTPSKQQSIVGGLDLLSLINTYNLDGRKVDAKANDNFRSTFLVAYEQLDKHYQKQNPGCLSLEKCLSMKPVNTGAYYKEGLDFPMTYGDFKRRYNASPTNGFTVKATEIYICPFCNHHLRSFLNLEKHKTKCIRAQRHTATQKTVNKQLVLRKVKSILQKSKLPSLKTKLSLQIKPGLQLRIKHNFQARLKNNLQKAELRLKEQASKIKKVPQPRNFACTKCTETFVSAQTLDMHMRFDHRPRPTCSICQRVFDCRRKLSEHVNRCTGKNDNLIKQNLGVVDILAPSKVFTCNKCENYFCNQDVLREHKLIANKRMPIAVIISDENEKASPTTPSSNEKFDFKVCVKNEPNFSLAIKTQKQNTGDNGCPYCGKEFQNSRRFRQHYAFCPVKMELLFKEKPLRSVVEDELLRPSKAKSKSPLKVKKRVTQCAVCKKRFGTDTELLKHVLNNHHKLQRCHVNLKCNQCARKFERYRKYCKHLKQHTRPNKCPTCNFRYFKTSKLLRFHMQVFHKQSYCTKCETLYELKKNHKCATKLHTFTDKEEDQKLNYTLVGRTLIIDKRFNEHGTFVCYVCTELFIHVPDLAMHLVSEHSCLHPFPCKHCMRSFKRPNQLVSHHKDEHNDETDYLGGSISIERIWLKHSIVECTEPSCEERLFLGEAHLSYHHYEKHGKPTKLSAYNGETTSFTKFMFNDKGGDLPVNSVSDFSTDEERRLSVFYVNATEELQLQANGNGSIYFNCSYCSKRFQRETTLTRHTALCEAAKGCKKRSREGFKRWNINEESVEESYERAPTAVTQLPKTYVKWKHRTMVVDDYDFCEFCRKRFQNKRLEAHRGVCKKLSLVNNGNALFYNDDNNPPIQPAGPSLDTILSPDNKFDEKVVSENEVITLQEIQQSLVPLAFPASPNDVNDVNDDAPIDVNNSASISSNINSNVKLSTDTENNVEASTETESEIEDLLLLPTDIKEVSVEVKDIISEYPEISHPFNRHDTELPSTETEEDTVSAKNEDRKKNGKRSSLFVESMLRNKMVSKKEAVETDERRQKRSRPKKKKKRKIIISDESSSEPENTQKTNTSSNLSTSNLSTSATTIETNAPKLTTANSCLLCNINFDTEGSLKIHVAVTHSKKDIPKPRQQNFAPLNSAIEHAPAQNAPLFIDLTEHLFTPFPNAQKKSARKRKQSNPQQLNKHQKTTNSKSRKQQSVSQEKNHHNDRHKHERLMASTPFQTHCKTVRNFPLHTNRQPGNIVNNGTFQQPHVKHQSPLLPLRNVLSPNTNNRKNNKNKNDIIAQLDIALYPPVPANDTFFTAPQWDRSAFDVWDVY